MIVISAEKVLNRCGMRAYLITKVSALKRDELPHCYLKENGPAIWMHTIIENGNFTNFLVTKQHDTLYEGGIYSEEKFNTFVEYANKAGERLQKIKEELKQKALDWNGKVVIKI